MTVKQLILRIFFGAEILFFAWTYFLGPHGRYALWALDEASQQVIAQNGQLEREVGRLGRRVKAWKANSFFKKKYAREKLQMAYPDDEIYYIQ